jgi:putative ABC transport system permease protein
VLQRIRLGDSIELAAPGGPVRLPVVGIFRDLTNQTGAIYVDLSLFRRYWRDDSFDLLDVFLRPGVTPADGKRRVLERFGSERRLFVFLNADLRAFVMNVGGQWFGLTYVQIVVAVLIAVLGIVNTLTVSIIDRRRELGILRAAGALRSQVRRTLWMEAMVLAFVGVTLGLALGGIGLFYQIETLHRSIIAMPLDYTFPTGIALALFPTMLGVAFLSALAPAESAVRARLVEALEYE